MGWAERLLRPLASRASHRPLPTADYYFLAGVGDLVSATGIATPRQPIVRFGPHTWAHADRLVIVRYVEPRELAAIEAIRWRSVHYVIDDLIPAAADSLELPADYREKLTRFSTTLLPRILAMAPTVVAPSEAILSLFPEHPRRRLDPACLPLLDPAGLPPPTAWQGPLRVAFLGTRSHAGSLPLLAAIAGRLERTAPDARLHVFLGRHLPASFAARRNVVNMPPIGWELFPSYCRMARFHVGLAPVQDTPFARARSLTKLMDYAAVGAVGIFARRPPFEGVIVHGETGLLCDDGEEAWTAAILDVASAPRRAVDMARAGAALAAERGDPLRLRRFWLKALALDGSFELTKRMGISPPARAGL